MKVQVILFLPIVLIFFQCSKINDPVERMNSKLTIEIKPQFILSPNYGYCQDSSAYVVLCQAVDYSSITLVSLSINNLEVEMHVDSSKVIQENGSAAYIYWGIVKNNLNELDSIIIALRTNQGLSYCTLKSKQDKINFSYNFGDTLSSIDTIIFNGNNGSEFTAVSFMTYSLELDNPCDINSMVQCYFPNKICDTNLVPNDTFKVPVLTIFNSRNRIKGIPYSLRIALLAFNGSLAEHNMNVNMIGADSIYASLFCPDIRSYRSIISNGIIELKKDSCTSLLFMNGILDGMSNY